MSILKEIGLLLFLVVILVTQVACGGSKASPSAATPVSTFTETITINSAATPIPTSTHILARTSTTALTAAPESTSASEIHSNQQELKPGYDAGTPSSVVEREKLFNYFRKVTGRFVGIQLSVPPLRSLPESFREELKEEYGAYFSSLSEKEFERVVKNFFKQEDVGPDAPLNSQGQIAIDIFSLPVNSYSYASLHNAWGHGIIVGDKVLTVIHVADEEKDIKSSLFRDVPPELISVRYKFLPLTADYSLQHPTAYTLKKLTGHPPEQYITWLSFSESHVIEASVKTEPDSGLFPEVKFGEWDELQYGTFLYVVTHDAIKEGIVGLPEQISEGWDTEGKSVFVVHLLDGNIFEIGDSGAPVFAIRGGVAEFVGLMDERKNSEPWVGVMDSSYFGFITIPYE